MSSAEEPLLKLGYALRRDPLKASYMEQNIQEKKIHGPLNNYTIEKIRHSGTQV